MEQGTSGPGGVVPSPPVKLCECGCGKAAPIAGITNSARGQVKGHPVRFIQGHAAKLKGAELSQGRLAEAPAGTKLCECGCGQPAPIAKMTSTARGYVKGRPMRYVARHHPGAKGPHLKQQKLFVEAGQRIGHTTVIDPEVRLWEPNQNREVRAVSLRCDCGAEYVRRIQMIFKRPDRPDAESCGCQGVRRFAELAGARFGKLTAIRLEGSKRTAGRRMARWLCACDCGNEVLVYRKNLTDGHARSCGCGRFGPQRGLTAGEAAFNGLMRTYQGHARNRGLPWNLSRDDFRRLTSLDCHYCGSAPSQTVKGHPTSGDYVYNGVDRVDSALGYSPGNVLPACGTCNFAKKDMPYADFLAWIARLAGYHFFRPEVMPSRMLAPPA